MRYLQYLIKAIAIETNKMNTSEENVPQSGTLSWNHRTYDDWLKEETKCWNFDNWGKNLWQNFFVKHCDYIANPSIKIKNRVICNFFLGNFIPPLDKSTMVFDTIKMKINNLI